MTIIVKYEVSQGNSANPGYFQAWRIEECWFLGLRIWQRRKEILI